MCWHIHKIWKTTTAVLSAQKVTRWRIRGNSKRNSLWRFTRSQSFWPHLCGATATPCIHNNLNIGPNMVMIHQAGYVWLLGYKVTNCTPSPNQIAPGEISDIIRYTFLTPLGCGCVELWITSPPCQRKSPHEESSTTNLFTKEETLWIRSVYRGGSWAIIQLVRRETKQITTLLFFFGQTTSSRRDKT